MTTEPLIGRLHLSAKHKEIFSGHLRLGGLNPLGERIGLTNYYLTRNDRPWIGISGEIHFSRFPLEYWEEELRKIKATGINLVSTYFFWNYHEPSPGQFDWSGNRNARHFIRLCAQCGLDVIVRVGPFGHGECRNGGLPDWLYGQPFEVRTNAPGYLAHVERYYQQLGQQLRGLWFKDGGPIVAMQLDNEYGHCGAPWETTGRGREVEWIPRGLDGEAHLEQLKRLALKAGMEAPLVTLTAWGDPNWAPILEDESLPVYGGYAYPTWVDNPGPSDLYCFQDAHANFAAAPDRKRNYYPVMNAEMQGGIQNTYPNRPVVLSHSTEALALVVLGSGSNFLGYYMYHGGSHAWLEGGFANEGICPQVSYDFQAPIGEYGEVRDSARYLKTLHLFLEAFGEELAPMGTVLPEEAEVIQSTDTGSLRFCARARDGAGYVFLNNFQDHLEMPDKPFSLELTLPHEQLRIPRESTLTLKSDVSCLLPFNFSLAGVRLVYATAQPLTVLHTDDEVHYFFFAPEGMTPEYCLAVDSYSRLEGDAHIMAEVDGKVYVQVEPGAERSFTLTTGEAKTVRVTTLMRHEAEHAWRGVAWGSERLIISNADLFFRDHSVELRSEGESDISLTVFPTVTDWPLKAHGATLTIDQQELLSRLRVSIPARKPDIQLKDCGAGRFQLDLDPDGMSGLNDIFLQFDYIGDVGSLFLGGRLIADNFNNGTPWRVGLKRFWPEALAQGLVARFWPLRKGQMQNISTPMANRMEFEGEEILRLVSFTVIPEYVARLS
ncbi:MAG TPA: beta-galactosidase [Anaerolineales bacterium]|nr:beta-galactosidase [Anaerolineales bacterium]